MTFIENIANLLGMIALIIMFVILLTIVVIGAYEVIKELNHDTSDDDISSIPFTGDVHIDKHGNLMMLAAIDVCGNSEISMCSIIDQFPIGSRINTYVEDDDWDDIPHRPALLSIIQEILDVDGDAIDPTDFAYMKIDANRWAVICDSNLTIDDVEYFMGDVTSIKQPCLKVIDTNSLLRLLGAYKLFTSTSPMNFYISQSAGSSAFGQPMLDPVDLLLLDKWLQALISDKDIQKRLRKNPTVQDKLVSDLITAIDNIK